jgi:hypothetical protein
MLLHDITLYNINEELENTFWARKGDGKRQCLPLCLQGGWRQGKTFPFKKFYITPIPFKAIS